MCSECARLLAVLLAFDSPTAGGGLRVTERSCPRCWPRVPRRGRRRRKRRGCRKKEADLSSQPLDCIMNRRGRTSAATRSTAANWQQTDVTYEQWGGSGWLHLEKREAECCPAKQHRCNITWNPRGAFSLFFVFATFNLNTPITNLMLAHLMTRRII